MKPTFQGEVMLLGWSESHNGGAKVTFQLADPSDLEPFKAMTVAKGKTAGQRLACVLVEIGEDEQPVPQQDQSADLKGGPLAKLAGMWCNEPTFWKWINEQTKWNAYGAEDAAAYVRGVCGVESRAQLDSDCGAAHAFHSMIREPYRVYLAAMEPGRVAA